MKGFFQICTMKLLLLSVGKAHDNLMSPGIEEFTRRIRYYFPVQWKIIAPLRNAGSLTDDELKQKEANQILAQIQKDDYLVTLDERGRSMQSTKLAEFLSQRAVEATRQIVFLIGGAYGVDDSIKRRSQLLLSFSSFTFPHQLMRLLLAEQIYRACTILRNEKYHHD